MSAKETSKAIRKELKANFPGIKFSVTTKSYNTCMVSWLDGPTSTQVSEVVNKYEYGHFNGMTDSYEMSNSIEGLDQCKFVMVQRDLSVEARLATISMIETKWDIEINWTIEDHSFSDKQYVSVEYANHDHMGCNVQEAINREASKTVFNFSTYEFNN